MSEKVCKNCVVIQVWYADCFTARMLDFDRKYFDEEMEIYNLKINRKKQYWKHKYNN